MKFGSRIVARHLAATEISETFPQVIHRGGDA
jgi:hypothetical protein